MVSKKTITLDPSVSHEVWHPLTEGLTTHYFQHFRYTWNWTTNAWDEWYDRGKGEYTLEKFTVTTEQLQYRLSNGGWYLDRDRAVRAYVRGLRSTARELREWAKGLTDAARAMR